jgi:hypothetical protein
MGRRGDRVSRRTAGLAVAAVVCVAVAAALVVVLVSRPGGRRPRPVAPGREVKLRTRGQALLVGADHPTNRVVIYVHGAGETASTALSDPLKAGIYRALLTHGFSIATDTAEGENWGNIFSIRDYLALARTLRRRGLTRVYILAQSMGGLDAIGLLPYLHPVAWAGIYPACNLRSMYNRPTAVINGATTPLIFPQEIREAYGADLTHALDSESPLTVPSDVRGIRMMFWASPQDTVVPMSENTDLCAAQARRRGARVTVVTTTGNHGDPSNFQPAQLLSAFGG